MFIENEEFLRMKIESSLYFYILSDFEDLEMFFKDGEYKKSVEKIFNEFVKYMREEYYKNENIEFNKMKSDYIIYSMDKVGVLEEIIEDVLY